MPDYLDPDDYNGIMDFIVAHETEQAQALGKLLYAHYQPKMVFDVGCGPGIYLLPFREQGCMVFGVDGASGAGKSLGAGEFAQVDLRQPWAISMRFDLALCIEVAEHLEERFADTLLDTLCQCADLIFFSAARLGQGDGGKGYGHFNEQPRSYWLYKFSQRGFFLHPENDLIRSVISSDPAYERVGWLRDNAMLLRKVQ